jgi:asparagine synthase (glutamine-hydrolysing)
MAFELEARVPFLDVQPISLAMDIPAAWKVHDQRIPKALRRLAVSNELPDKIVNRPKARFSKGAGSSQRIPQRAVEKISDQDFMCEYKRLKEDRKYNLQNKEALYYYRIRHEF